MNTTMPEEITDGFRLLGTPIGSTSFINEYFLQQLHTVNKQCILLTQQISDLQTHIKLFNTCTLQKLPHLLGSNIMHNLPNDFNPSLWQSWNGPLTQGINQLINTFLQQLSTTDNNPEHAKCISQQWWTRTSLPQPPCSTRLYHFHDHCYQVCQTRIQGKY